MRRYPGTTPFKPEDAPVYKGRTTETQDVTNLVLTQKTLVLFARSGMGKTSLLNAGVVPKLKPYNFYPVFIRFNEISSDTADDPVARFMAQYQETYQAFTASRSRATPFNPQSTLWEMMCQNQLIVRRDALIPTLIFDQFEEFFRTYPQRDQRKLFLEQLAELLSDTIPHQQPLPGQQATVGGEVKPLNIRVVFSIRSDLLNLMQEVSDYLPFVMRTRYELLPMNSVQATEAIREPGQVADGPYECGPVTFPDDVKEDILTGLRDPFSGEFEPFQLQLVCSYLEDKYTGEGKSTAGAKAHTVKKEDYGGVQGIQNINEVYFSTTINAIKEQPRKDVMNALITLLNDNGNRILKEDSQLDLRLPVKDKLVDRRIMKRDKIQANVYYEISHDKIALALQKEKVRINEWARRRKYATWFVVIGFVVLAVSLTAFTLYQTNESLKTTRDSLNRTVTSLTVTQANLTATVKSLTTAEASLKQDTVTLTNKNNELKEQEKALIEKINQLNRAKLSKDWGQYDDARRLMAARLFNQALTIIPTVQQPTVGVYNGQQLGDEVKPKIRHLKRLVVQAQQICADMREVQQLVEEAECLELSLRIACANKKYQAAKQQQLNYINRYGMYCYPVAQLDEKIKTTDEKIATGIRLGFSRAGFSDDAVKKMKIDNTDSCACKGPKRLQL
jgi:hypothetical protein